MRTLLALLTFLIIPATAFCGTSLSSSQVQALTEINTKISVVHELATADVITATQEAKADSLYCQQAKQIVGHDVTPQEIQTLVVNGEKTQGLGTFWTILIVLGGFITALGLIAVFIWFFKGALEEIPAAVYEVAAYIVTAAICTCGYWWASFSWIGLSIDPVWFVVPGALALAGCITLTQRLHFNAPKPARSGSYMGPGLINFPTVMFGLCTLAWGYMAVTYSHLFPASGIPHVLAFGAVIALQACLGFSVITMPGCVAMGWTKDSQVPKSVLSSFIILFGYIVLKQLGLTTGTLGIFAPGAIFMGAFVYYLGLLVMSSKWYVWSHKGKTDVESRSRFIVMQIVTIASGIAALYLGSVLGLGALLGVGGTFFVLYLLELYYEIPWSGIGWAVSLVGLGVFIYLVVGFANNHPQLFIWGIR